MPDEPISRRELEAYISAHSELHAVHDRAHQREHTMTQEAMSTAASGMDKRLEGMNEVRSQLRDQAGTFVRSETYQALVDRVIAIEKLDIKGEGRALGQGATVGLIVGAVGLTATVLGIVVVLANLLTTS